MQYGFAVCSSIEVLQTYTQERTTQSHLFQESLPALDEMTACFWVKKTGNNETGRLFTIADKGAPCKI